MKTKTDTGNAPPSNGANVDTKLASTSAGTASGSPSPRRSKSRKSEKEIDFQLRQIFQAMFRKERRGDAMLEKIRKTYNAFCRLWVREIKRGIIIAYRQNGRVPDIPSAIETMCKDMGFAIVKDKVEARNLDLHHCLCGYYLSFEQLEHIMEAVAWEMDALGTWEFR